MNTIDFNRHPCFNAKVKGQYGRVHLPIAPNYNIQCNFCNRKYDCVNESRPGVTSTILIPGINDHHIIEVASAMKEMSADLFNCMAMLPNADTVFENVPEPSKEVMKETCNEAEKHLPQMPHCTRCRADAVGLLDNDRTDELHSCLSACTSLPKHSEATRFQIWAPEPAAAETEYISALCPVEIGLPDPLGQQGQSSRTQTYSGCGPRHHDAL